MTGVSTSIDNEHPLLEKHTMCIYIANYAMSYWLATDCHFLQQKLLVRALLSTFEEKKP